ncbi:MAG: DUF4838 domain-containing protein, partial [Armatimonadetes bacterium]|nr:DUF4838 domain-containing protein [Armatimonadota bacterium]
MRTSLLLAATLLTTAAVADLTLVRDGATRGTIITLGDTPEVAEAGEALQSALFKMSGARVRVLMGFPRSRTNEIIVFVPADQLDSAYAPDAAKPLAAKIRDDGFALHCDDTRALYIIAKKPAAFVFGAYEVLQRLGCRWFFPGELGEEIPARPTVTLPATSEVQNPDMVDRNMWYAYGGRPAWQKDGYALWRKRNKMGGAAFSAGHNLARIVPPKVFGPTHPEYFPLWGSERHVPGDEESWQPCTSNPEVIALAVAAADKHFTENPQASSFSLSPNDGYGWCQCEACKAQDPPEHRDQRNQYKGRRTLLFVNAVAREIATKHPGKLLAWYAYAGTVEPPTDVKAEPNVLTALAHYGYVGCNIHAMADPTCANNQKFMAIMDGWSKVADKLMIREYWVSLVGEEDAMARVCAGYSLAEDIPLLVKRGFIGASAEAEPECGSAAINFYLAAKMMWNSRQPLEPILADYYAGMYGPAGPAMRAFFEGIVKQCRERGPHFADADYPRMAAELEKIAPLAATDKQRARIQMTQDFLKFTTLLQSYSLRPVKDTREQIEALVAGVEAKQQFTLDTVMFKHNFLARSKAAPIKEPEKRLVGPVRLALPEAQVGEKALAAAPVIRTRQVVALLVPPGEKLAAEVQLRRLGRYTHPVAWLVMDAAGNTVAQGEANLETTGTMDLPEAQPGVYTLIAESGSNASRVVSPLKGMAFAGPDFSFLGGQPPLYFLVPEDLAGFTIRLETDAPGETGKLQVLDPDGKVAGEGDTIANGQTAVTVAVPDGMRGKVWSLKLGGAATGVCEDLRLFLDEKLPRLLATDPG